MTDTASGTTTVAISGGGPAGVMLGLLLARQGVEVTVLEKHADFLRDFRGDTVHPMTPGDPRPSSACSPSSTPSRAGG